MNGKKMAFLALGLVAVCSHPDPLAIIAQPESQAQRIVVEASAFDEVENTANNSEEVEALVDSFMEEDSQQKDTSLVKTITTKADRVVEKKLERAVQQSENAKAEEARQKRIAEKKRREAMRKLVIAQAKAAKAAAEKEIAKDATGSYYNGVRLMSTKEYSKSVGHLTRSNGSIRYNGHRETWYSTKEPGQTVTAVRIPGKHVAEDGIIRDADGYVCVAANQRYLRIYSTLMTSVGPAKVYDTGCSYGTIDIYTTW